jgi:hypothetical protein
MGALGESLCRRCWLVTAALVGVAFPVWGVIFAAPIPATRGSLVKTLSVFGRAMAASWRRSLLGGIVCRLQSVVVLRHGAGLCASWGCLAFVEAVAAVLMFRGRRSLSGWPLAADCGGWRCLQLSVRCGTASGDGACGNDNLR